MLKTKLIIWDLDDTLWTGTLAEGDSVVLNEKRADIVRQLNRHGLVSAIASKNNSQQAQSKLEEFGLWDEFVFRRIAFSPKGPLVKSIIEDMNLQPKHVLFIDDNRLNLLEVQHAVPDINVLDATSIECDRMLDELLTANSHIQKSRVDEYRMLDTRLSDQASSSVSREDFLHTCGIRTCIVDRMDNLDFAKRIEELINRTNQLNFLKTRVSEGSMPEYISDVTRHDTYALFVWDNYGHHGLVGFAAVEGGTVLRHFTFSCRIMHMGIEQWFLQAMLDRHPKLEISSLALTPRKSPWVKHEQFNTPDTRRYILDRDSSRSIDQARLRIMANCQSGAMAHFGGLGSDVDFDNMPRFFSLRQAIEGTLTRESFPPHLVYGPFSDYWDTYWPEHVRGKAFAPAFREAAAKFIDHLRERDISILVLLPPEDAEESKYHWVSRALTAELNQIWRDLSNDYARLTVLEISLIAEPSELTADARHFEVPLLRKIGLEIASWFEQMGKNAPPRPRLQLSDNAVGL